MPLTGACCVHSNVNGLGNICWITYLTAVDPLHSTSSAAYTYHHLTSGSVEFPLATIAGYFSSIGKEPVSWGRSIPNIWMCATSSEVSYTEQGISPFTNVLQGHTTVVLVCCTSEWEPDITCTWKESDINVTMLKPVLYVFNVIVETTATHLWMIPLKSKTFLLSYFYSHPQSFHSLCQPNGIPVTTLYYTILYYTMILYCTVLYCTVLYCTVLYCTVLYYTILYYTILYYTMLYYTILTFNMHSTLGLQQDMVTSHKMQAIYTHSIVSLI